MRERIIDFFCDIVVVPLLVIMMAFSLIVFLILTVGGIQEYLRPTFVLKKGDWTCTLLNSYQTEEPLLVGKMIIVQKIEHHDCIRWEHK